MVLIFAVPDRAMTMKVKMLLSCVPEMEMNLDPANPENPTRAPYRLRSDQMQSSYLSTHPFQDNHVCLLSIAQQAGVIDAVSLNSSEKYGYAEARELLPACLIARYGPPAQLSPSSLRRLHSSARQVGTAPALSSPSDQRAATLASCRPCEPFSPVQTQCHLLAAHTGKLGKHCDLSTMLRCIPHDTSGRKEFWLLAPQPRAHPSI
mmetsp:Transcript_778/g.1555  ORF Transcript_778/g.1555 Transcript_778/m.1555 type:complete len:206 (+) Transcript_778:802-1419(+)